MASGFGLGFGNVSLPDLGPTSGPRAQAHAQYGWLRLFVPCEESPKTAGYATVSV